MTKPLDKAERRELKAFERSVDARNAELGYALALTKGGGKKKLKKAKKQYREALARTGSQLLTQAERFKYDESESRDEHGRWTSGGGGSDGGSAAAFDSIGSDQINEAHADGVGAAHALAEAVQNGNLTTDHPSRIGFEDVLGTSLSGSGSHDALAALSNYGLSSRENLYDFYHEKMGKRARKAFKRAVDRAHGLLLPKYSDDQPRDADGKWTHEPKDVVAQYLRDTGAG